MQSPNQMMSEMYYLELFIMRDGIKLFRMFLYERGGQCGSSGQVLVCHVLGQCCPGQRATGDIWTASHPGGHLSKSSP